MPVRIHAEHGRDAGDPDGINRKHNLLRRRLAPFIDRYVPVSADLQRWLGQVVGIPAAKTQLIDNGVDTDHFHAARRPRAGASPSAAGCIRHRHRRRASRTSRTTAAWSTRSSGCARCCRQQRDRLRLAIVGDGPLLPALRAQVAAAGLDDVVWLPGARTDIAELMRSFSRVRAALAGRRHAGLAARGDGLRPAGGRHARRRHSRSGRRRRARHAGAAGRSARRWPRRWRAMSRDPRWRASTAPPAALRIEQRFSMTAMLAAYSACTTPVPTAAGASRAS